MTIENLGVKLYSGVKTDRVADSLGSSADGTVSGVTLDTTNQKLGSGCYSYDASSDSVDIPADINLGVTGTSSFTITGWFNLDSVGANREIFRNQVSNGQAKVEIYYTHGNQTIICDLGGTTTKILSKVETGKWYHLTIRRVSGDKDYFYINGHLSQTNSTQSDVTGASGSIWYIGNRKEKNEAMIGKLDDIGFFSRALEESEIQSLTNTTVTQGYKGGLGGDASPYSGGGGGGAGGAGGNGSSGVAGAGGIGKENPITGSEIGELNGGKYWLGGGGGGFGNTSSGAGGKGGGSGNNSGDNGTANTGGGAGARDGNTGAGGSGVVLVSYQTSQITDGSSDGSLETGSNIPSGYAIRKFVLTGSSTENFDFVISSGSGNVQYVIVGGGGGGGTDSYSSARASGGGGGGGFVTGTKSMSAGTYSVTVGRGGADTTNGSNNDGGDGDNSVFDGTTAYGGGGGATHYSSESAGFWGRAGCKGTGGGGNNSSITRGLAVYNTDTGALVSTLSVAGLKAYYNMDTASASGQVLNEDFSGYADQAAADAAWVSQDTAKTRVNISTDKLDWAAVNDGTNDAVTHDLSSALSDTKWICRFKMTIDDADNSGLAPGQDRNQLAVGMFDKSSATAYNGTIEGIYLQLHLDRDGTDRTYFSRSTGGQLDQLNSRVGDFSTTTYYVEIKRTSDSNATMSMWTDGYDGSSALSSTPVTLTNCSGINDLQYFGVRNSHYNYGSNMDGTISEVMIYDDVTSVPSPQMINNASTTAPISSLTGVRTNSIFQQVNDTPSYWWFNGTSWVLDGTTEKDLTSSSQTWTKVGTSIVKTDNTITATSATDTGSGSTGANRVYTTLPSTLSNTAHVTDFDLKITANASAGDPDIVPIMYTAGTGAFGAGSQDGYGFDMYSDSGSGNNYNMRLIARDGTDNDYSATITLIPQTQYYCRLVRNSADLGTLNVYSDSARTTHISGSPKTLTIASGSARGEDCTHLQSSSWSQSGSTSYIVSNVKLQNGRSTWLE